MSKYARRKDANHAVVIGAFRACGALAIDTSRLGEDFPDAVIGFKRVWKLVEIKDGDKPPSARRLSEGQEKFHVACGLAGLPVLVVERVEQVPALLAHWTEVA